MLLDPDYDTLPPPLSLRMAREAYFAHQAEAQRRAHERLSEMQAPPELHRWIDQTFRELLAEAALDLQRLRPN